MPEMNKDTFTINEVEALSGLVQDVNRFLVDQEDAEVYVAGAVLLLHDRHGVAFGALTKWSPLEDIKFEPGFVAPELFG